LALLHSSQGSSTLYHVSEFPSFSMLSNTPLSGYIPVCLFIHKFFPLV
jgi:hypothetical protein